MTIFFMMLASLFTVLMILISYEQQPQSGFFGLIAMILWWVSSAMIISVDVPYSHLDNTNTVVTGTLQVTTNYPLAYIFIGLGFICLAYSIFGIAAMLLKGREK